MSVAQMTDTPSLILWSFSRREKEGSRRKWVATHLRNAQ
jgi:hypothetical protein